jgi:hypothetical protein
MGGQGLSKRRWLPGCLGPGMLSEGIWWVGLPRPREDGAGPAVALALAAANFSGKALAGT